MRQCWHAEGHGLHTWGCLQLDMDWAREQRGLHKHDDYGPRGWHPVAREHKIKDADILRYRDACDCE